MKYEKSELLNELFELSPFNLSVYCEIAGVPIRSSDKIVDNVKEFMSEHPTTKPIFDKISEGLDKRTIVVGYSVKPLTFYWKKFKHCLNYIDFVLRGRTISGKDVITLGFYDPENMKIVILLDDNVDIFGRQIREIPVKLTHEMCHYCADINFNSFITSTMNKSLLPFYKDLLLNVAPRSSKLDDSKIKESIKSVASLNEGVSMLKPHVPETFRVWAKLVNNVYNKQESIKIAQHMSLPYYAFITDELDSKYLDTAMSSAVSYYDSYSTSFGLNVKETTIPGQEFRFPSEVIAVANEFRLSDDVLKLINSTTIKDYR